MDWLIIIIWLFGGLIIAAGGSMIAKKAGLGFIIGIFTSAILIANVMAAKFVQIGPLVANGSIVAYSITFLLSDTIAEFWGKKAAKKAVLSGFFSYVLFLFMAQIITIMTPASFWMNQEAFEAVFGTSWRVAIASIVAYIVAQSHDVWAYHFWKQKTKGKYLWLRNNLSTGVSQVMDTILFIGIAFMGTAPIGQVILSSILLKFIIAALDTPFLYLIRWYYEKVGEKFKRRHEGALVPLA